MHTQPADLGIKGMLFIEDMLSIKDTLSIEDMLSIEDTPSIEDMPSQQDTLFIENVPCSASRIRSASRSGHQGHAQPVGHAQH